MHASRMATSAPFPGFLSAAVLSVSCLSFFPSSTAQWTGLSAKTPPPSPNPWPEQFHAVLFQNRSSKLALVDLWYDWPGGKVLNLIRSQLGGTLYDVEWTNGTSFYFNKELGSCKTVTFPVGIPPPSWLQGGTYLGTETVDGTFLCHVWTKADFIQYYEDVKWWDEGQSYLSCTGNHLLLPSLVLTPTSSVCHGPFPCTCRLDILCVGSSWDQVLFLMF